MTAKIAGIGSILTQHPMKLPFLNLFLAAGLTLTTTFTAHAQTLYVANQSTNTIETYNSTTGALINSSFVTGLYIPLGMAGDAATNTLYVADGTGVLAFNATTGVAVSGFSLKLAGTVDVQVSGSTLYVSNNAIGVIGKYNATTGVAIKANFITGLNNDSRGITLNGGNIYVVNNGDISVGEFDAATGEVVANPLISSSSFFSSPEFITSAGSILYVTDSSYQTIGTFDAATGEAINSSFVNLDGAFGVTYESNVLYATGRSYSGRGIISAYDATSGDVLGGFTPTDSGSRYTGLAVINAVPEPNTWALLITGGIGSMLALRRRR